MREGFKYCLSVLLSLAIYLGIGSPNNRAIAGSWAQKIIPLISQEQQNKVQPLPIEEPLIKKIVAEGIATIYEGNIDTARKTALRAAYAEAVSRGCGTEIGSMSIIRNVKFVSDVVYTRSRGFIRRYQVLSEGADSQYTKYRIVIEAEVIDSGKAQENDVAGLKLFLEVLGNPQLLIILPEAKRKIIPSNFKQKETKVEITDQESTISVAVKSDNSSKSGGESGDSQFVRSGGTIIRSAEYALARAFSRYGYRVQTSDDISLDGRIQKEKISAARNGDTQNIRNVAIAYGADLVLYGLLQSETSETKLADVDMVKVVAEASAKAMIVSNGRLIEAFHHTEQTANFSELKAYSDCMDKVAKNIADALAWKIPQILAYENRETRLIISGIGTVERFQQVLNSLRNVPGIEVIQPVKIPSAKQDQAEYRLLTAFIPVESEEIIRVCSNALNGHIQIDALDKFEIRCSLLNSN